jgi:hypothetical protein
MMKYEKRLWKMAGANDETPRRRVRPAGIFRRFSFILHPFSFILHPS